MKAFMILPFLALLAFSAIAQPPSNQIRAQGAPALGSIWSIAASGLKGEPLGKFRIQFLGESGEWSCGGGRWNKARLLQRSVQSAHLAKELAKEFEGPGAFPIYFADGQRLTIQLKPMCDGGLFLRGRFSAREGKGDFFETKRGNWEYPLGTFTAIRQEH
jgi:hypothetical protein